jgi:hypothetical protein
MIVRGKILDIIGVTDTLAQIVLQVKKDESYTTIAFTAYQDTIILIKHLLLEKGDYVKVTFFVRSKKYETKYYTNAILEKISLIAKKSQQLEVDMETGEII